MHNLRKLAAFGLLWLAFTAIGYSAPIVVTFDVTEYSYPILNGGQFLGSINGAPAVAVYCNDWQNDLLGTGILYPAYLSDATDISKTRFGTTPSSGFSYPLNPPGTPVLTALDRYTLAAWLTTQLAFPSGGATPDDEAIQTAIWVLLSQTGVTPPILPNQALVDTWLNNAINFKANNVGFSAVQSAMRIVTSTDTVSYTQSGQQELIFEAPEPGTYVLIGGGLLSLAFARRRRV